MTSDLGSKQRQSQKSLSKLLQHLTEANEELTEENEKYARDQASLLSLLGQKDAQLKQTESQIKATEMFNRPTLAAKLLLRTYEKYTVTLPIVKFFSKWAKMSVNMPTKRQMQGKGVGKVVRVLQRQDGVLLKRYFEQYKENVSVKRKKLWNLHKVCSKLPIRLKRCAFNRWARTQTYLETDFEGKK